MFFSSKAPCSRKKCTSLCVLTTPCAVDKGGMIVLPSTSDVESARQRCYYLSLCKVIGGLGLAACFWAAFGWVIIFVGVCLSTGVSGISHLRSQEAIYTNDCCCTPNSALSNLHHIAMVNTAVGVTSAVSSMLAMFYYSGSTRSFAIASLALCISLTIVEVLLVFSLSSLRDLVSGENGMLAMTTRHVQVAPETFGPSTGGMPSMQPQYSPSPFYGQTQLASPQYDTVVIGVPIQPSFPVAPPEQPFHAGGDEGYATVRPPIPSYATQSHTLGYGGQ